MTRIPELAQGADGRVAGTEELVRIANQNFRQLRDQIERLILTGGLVGGHGLLTGLANDDHPQYHNDARGDARYAQRANDLSDLASAATARTNLALGAMAVEADDPNDAQEYVRKSNAWAVASGGIPPTAFDLLTDGVSELVFAGGDVVWIT